MTELHLPLLSVGILMALLGAIGVGCLHDVASARRWTVGISAVVLACMSAASLDFLLLSTATAVEPIGWFRDLIGVDNLLIDELSAPLLPIVALLHFLVVLTTKRVKRRRFSFGWSLATEAITLATFACRQPWGVIALLALGTAPPWFELHTRGKPTRAYSLHMVLFVVLLVTGWSAVEGRHPATPLSLAALVALLVAVGIRSGIAPFHGWLPDLFERASLGASLLYVLPLTGAYAAARLVLPVAPEGLLHDLGLLSVISALYTAGLAAVQTDLRRLVCYLLLSQSALVLIGLQIVTPIGITAALCLWTSVALSVGGFGLAVRSLEARFGHLSLREFHGLYEQVPTLAVCFALTGLATVGFPGTLGFVAGELLIDGAIGAYPYVGVLVIIAMALNGIAVVRAHFLLFTGRRHASSVSLRVTPRERLSLLALVALLIGGGIAAQPWVASRYHAASELLARRRTNSEQLVDKQTAANKMVPRTHAAESMRAN